MKRSNGEGNIWYDKQRKRYQFSLRYTNIKGDKKRVVLVSSKKKNLLEKIDKWKSTHKTLDRTYIDDISIKQWIDIWLETIIKPSVRHSTYEKYKFSLLTIKNRFGNYKISELNALEIQEFFNEQLNSGGKNNKGLAPLTIRHQRRYFISCIDSAIKFEHTKTNVVKDTVSPRIKKREMVDCIMNCDK